MDARRPLEGLDQRTAARYAARHRTMVIVCALYAGWFCCALAAHAPWGELAEFLAPPSASARLESGPDIGPDGATVRVTCESLVPAGSGRLCRSDGALYALAVPENGPPSPGTAWRAALLPMKEEAAERLFRETARERGAGAALAALDGFRPFSLGPARFPDLGQTVFPSLFFLVAVWNLRLYWRNIGPSSRRAAGVILGIAFLLSPALYAGDWLLTPRSPETPVWREAWGMEKKRLQEVIRRDADRAGPVTPCAPPPPDPSGPAA